MTRSRRRRFVLAAVAAFAFSTRSAPALADEPGAYEAALTRGVLARDRALESKSADAWREALAAFGEAVGRRDSKEAWFELGAAAAELQLDDEAFDAYEQALERGLEGRAAEQARGFLATHAPSMARLELVGPAGAAVAIRGRPRGLLPLARALVVPAGAVRVRVELAGFVPWERDVPVSATTSESLGVELVPVRPSEPPASPPRARPSAPRRGARAERGDWGASALIGGGALAVASTGTMIVTSLLLSEERDTLERSCVVRSGDECVKTTEARRADAQAAGDTILTLKAVRWGAVAGAALGVAAASAGLLNLFASADQAPAGQLTFDLSQKDVSIRWRSSF